MKKKVKKKKAKAQHRSSFKTVYVTIQAMALKTHARKCMSSLILPKVFYVGRVELENPPVDPNPPLPRSVASSD